MQESAALRILYKEVVEAKESLQESILRGFSDHIKYREALARYDQTRRLAERIHEIHTQHFGEET